LEALALVVVANSYQVFVLAADDDSHVSRVERDLELTSFKRPAVEAMDETETRLVVSSDE
jgi:hypothetical protein